ncbi:SpoIIE family protein phosphatase [Desulfovibrio inopinatus]|uniref:SpoIIE family protein phosphatase n=1 Tax=Desulfovibrio inopinatus TaxID=102109 RepID=UPI00041B11F6|nr:SpoIIE family protein phosphatase [Desulfovibrio inopinatus]
MRMRIKIFCLLLFFSLVPLILSITFVHFYAKERSAHFSTGVKGILRRVYEHELVNSARDSSIILRKDFSYVEMAVRSLSLESKQVLSNRLEDDSGQSLFFVERAELPKHFHPAANDATHDGATPTTPGYERIVYYLYKGKAGKAARGAAASLNSLLPYFQSVILNPDNIAWRIYVCLDDGIHAAYPVQGILPKGYDPKSRPWYVKALQNPGDVVWSGPMPDASSQRIVFTCSQAVLDNAGHVLGVAAMDVLLKAVLSDNVASSALSKELETYIVSRDETSGAVQFNILATRQYEDEKTSWNESVQIKPLEFSDEESKALFMRAIEVEHAGRITLPFEGEETIWAFSKLFSHSYFLLLLPTSSVNKVVDQPMDILASIMRDQRYKVGAALPILMLAAAATAFFSSRRMSNQFQAMIDAWNRLGQGDFTTRLTLKTNDERDRLVEAFNEMVPKLEEHVAMSKALALAHEVQQELLPSCPPTLPGFDIAGISVSCDQTGGDYYDYFFRENGHLALIVADVCGHGIPAALLMATLKGALRQRADQPGEPAAIITDVNRQIANITQGSGRFLTAFYAEIDPKSMTITTVRAGHDPALVYDRKAETWDELMGKGIAVGVIPDVVYTEETHRLRPNHILLVGTDGIWEAKNEAGELMGKKPMHEAIRQNADNTAAAIIDDILHAVEQHRGHSKPDDDVTMIVVRVKEKFDEDHPTHTAAS